MIVTKRLTLPHLERQKEQAIFREALKKSREEATVRVLFIGGNAGAGKSTLVSDVLSSATSSGHWTATAKFDQRSSTVPFAALREILSSLIQISVAEEPSCVLAIRKEISEVQLKTLIGFVSSSSRCLISEEEKKEEDCGINACTSTEDITMDGLPVLISTLRVAFRAITSLAPVILFFEDIHWADTATLDVLQTMLTCQDLKNVVFCATYRNENVAVDDGSTTATTTTSSSINNSFRIWKEQVEQNAIYTTQTIQLDELDLEAVQELLAEATNLEISQVQDLAESAFHFTHGNLLALKELIKTLQDDNLLTFDYNNYRWTWDLQEIKRRSSLSDNVVKSLTARIHKLPESTQDALKLASCFSSPFDIRALHIAKSALNIDCVYTCLERACKEEFLTQLSETRYKFSHDMIQTVAYGLIPEDIELTKVHWDIGTLLFKHGASLLQEESILFATVDHLNTGCTCIDECNSDEMRINIAELNYKAGTIAAGLSAFWPAKNYLKAAIDVLGSAPFQEHYELAMKMYPLYAKTAYVVGEIETSMEAAQQVIDHGQTWEDKESSVLVLLPCYIAKQQLAELVEKGLEIVSGMGMRVHPNPTAIQTHFEFRRIRSRIQKLSDDQILGLPPSRRKEMEMISKVLNLMVFPLFHLERQRLSIVVICRMLEIMLNEGLTTSAPEALAFYGGQLVSQFADVKEAHRFGNLALQLLKRRGSDAYSEVDSFIAEVTKWWREPIASSLDVMIDNNKVAMTSGDIAGAFRASVVYGVNYYYSGMSLEPLLQDVVNFSRQYIQYEHQLYFFLLSPLHQCLLNLTGRSNNPSSMEEGDIIAKRKTMPNPQDRGQQSIWSFGMQLAYYFDDIDKAAELAEKLSHVVTGVMQSSFFVKSRSCFIALVAIASYRKARKRRDKSRAMECIKEFRKYVKAGAINLVHKLQLLEAEMAGCVVKDSAAVYAKYEDAVVSSTRAGFLQDAALANYLCFRFIKRRNINLHMAELYARESVELWVKWGAVAVAEDIVRRHPDIFKDSSSIDNLVGTTGSQRDSYRSRERFDASLSLRHKELNV